MNDGVCKPLLVLLFLSLVVMGCGSENGSEEEKSPSSPRTGTQYVTATPSSPPGSADEPEAISDPQQTRTPELVIPIEDGDSEPSPLLELITATPAPPPDNSDTNAYLSEERVARSPLPGIYRAKFSPNGEKIFVAGGQLGWLWSIDNQVTSFAGHRDTINAIVFGRNREGVLTGSNDQTARLWNPATGEVIRRFEGHGDAVTTVDISPDDLTIVTGSKDRFVRFWRPDATEEIAKVDIGGTVDYVVFNSDGQRLLIRSGEDVRVVDLATRQTSCRISDPARHAMFSPDDGEKIITTNSHPDAEGPFQVTIWDPSCEPQNRITIEEKVRSMASAFNREGTGLDNTAIGTIYLITADDNDTLRLRDLLRETVILSETHPGVTSVDISPKTASDLITVDQDGFIRVWSISLPPDGAQASYGRSQCIWCY